MCFLIFSSDESSWKKTAELLVQVASHGENNGFEVPCLIVSAKDDLGPYQSAIQDSTRVSNLFLDFVFLFILHDYDHKKFYAVG